MNKYNIGDKFINKDNEKFKIVSYTVTSDGITYNFKNLSIDTLSSYPMKEEYLIKLINEGILRTYKKEKENTTKSTVDYFDVCTGWGLFCNTEENNVCNYNNKEESIDLLKLGTVLIGNALVKENKNTESSNSIEQKSYILSFTDKEKVLKFINTLNIGDELISYNNEDPIYSSNNYKILFIDRDKKLFKIYHYGLNRYNYFTVEDFVKELLSGTNHLVIKR